MLTGAIFCFYVNVSEARPSASTVPSQVSLGSLRKRLRSAISVICYHYSVILSTSDMSGLSLIRALDGSDMTETARILDISPVSLLS
uniref:Uncharacterized protein n=1 Tax=Parascaris equorum TaxID=6256 RepID=A0A914RMJ8_PAREQ